LSGKEEQICFYYRFAVVNFFLSSESFSIMLNTKMLANHLVKTQKNIDNGKEWNLQQNKYFLLFVNLKGSRMFKKCF